MLSHFSPSLYYVYSVWIKNLQKSTVYHAYDLRNNVSIQMPRRKLTVHPEKAFIFMLMLLVWVYCNYTMKCAFRFFSVHRTPLWTQVLSYGCEPSLVSLRANTWNKDNNWVILFLFMPPNNLVSLPNSSFTSPLFSFNLCINTTQSLKSSLKCDFQCNCL